MNYPNYMPLSQHDFDNMNMMYYNVMYNNYNYPMHQYFSQYALFPTYGQGLTYGDPCSFGEDNHDVVPMELETEDSHSTIILDASAEERKFYEQMVIKKEIQDDVSINETTLDSSEAQRCIQGLDNTNYVSASLMVKIKNEPQDELFFCRTCQFHFFSKTDLISHYKTREHNQEMHKLLKLQSDVDKFKMQKTKEIFDCIFCRKSFDSVSTRRQHEKLEHFL
jgi:hypothetical protein